MSLEVFWFCLIAVLWSGLLRAGGLRLRRRHAAAGARRATSDDRQLAARHDRPGLGRQRGLARRRGGRHVRGLPGLVRDDVLGLLPGAAADPRLPHRARRRRSSGASSGDGPRWRATWPGRRRAAASARRCSWGVALGDLLHGVPIDADGDFTGDVARPVQPATPSSPGSPSVALFAFHGATFLALRTRRRRCARAPPWRPARLSLPVAVVAGGFLAWTSRWRSTATTGAVPAGPAGGAGGGRGWRSPSLLVRPRRSAWAFAATAVATALVVATLFTGLYPRVLVSAPGLRQQPDDLRRRLRALRAERDHRRGGDPHAGRAALPGLDLPRLPRGWVGGDPRGAGATPVAVPTWTPRLRARARPAAAARAAGAPLLALDVGLGLAAAACSRRPRCWPRIVARGFDGAPLADAVAAARRCSSLVVAGARRAGLGRPRSRAGARPRACCPSCAWRSCDRRLTRRSRRRCDGAAGRRDRAAAVAGVDALEALLRPLPAAGRPGGASCRSRSLVVGRRRRPASALIMLRDAAARARCSWC